MVIPDTRGTTTTISKVKVLKNIHHFFGLWPGFRRFSPLCGVQKARTRAPKANGQRQKTRRERKSPHGNSDRDPVLEHERKNSWKSARSPPHSPLWLLNASTREESEVAGCRSHFIMHAVCQTTATSWRFSQTITNSKLCW
jgi:hypothetical protein